VIARFLVAACHGYKRFVSPIMPPACRYMPTCSEYAAQAISLHGAGKGSWLAMKRICRCHPWGGHGYDPVPPPTKPQT
jgi:putative membrane protein insertion efficiency factor